MKIAIRRKRIICQIESQKMGKKFVDTMLLIMPTDMKIISFNIKIKLSNSGYREGKYFTHEEVWGEIKRERREREGKTKVEECTE